MAIEKKNDEIDLLELFLKIYIFIKKNFWILFISSIIGGALGYSAKFFTNKHYESTMIIETYTLKNDILVEYINSLQDIIEYRNYDYLSSRFEIEKEKLSGLNKIEATKISDDKTKKDLEYIKVFTKSINRDIYNQLSAGIEKYLKSEIYVKNEIEIFIEQNNALIEKIDKEITQLEELKQKRISDSQNVSELNIYNERISSNDIILGLIKEKQELQKHLKFATPFRIIQDFSICKPIKRATTYTLSGFLLFGFITLGFLINKEISKKVNSKINI
ncbi:MAG: hypothetical protein A2041_00415 [Bacteroidetes bacterium GWA2_31_9b]|nr:MAG: hypothetical protein A2041_00415 [Bacteroidetes bacterium GWA2_31_9b]